ncbi:MAG: lycopene cyclase domain-containing protein [Ginsengibacter sp.]
MQYTYLLINFFTIFIPFIFSFHPKIRFDKKWRYFFPAVILVAVLFIIWDDIFTSLGVWQFNDDYILGIYLFNLPLEEILFFICIPYSCVFTFYCLDKFYNLKWNSRIEAIYCIVFSLLLLVVGVFFIDRIYTSITMFTTAAVCLTLKFLSKVDWFGKATFVYSILLIPFVIVNGILTGSWIESPIVSYNPAENMGIRLLTIPVEDIFYGFEMILLNIYFMKLFEKKWAGKEEELVEVNSTNVKSRLK